MKRILVVTDLQTDFVDGALGTKEAQAIIPAVCEKIQNFDGEVVFTMDTHTSQYPETQEGKKLPVPHCIRGTDGWQLDSRVQPLSEGCRIIEKPAFGSVELAKYVADGGFDEIEVIGLCTDICVISNAMLLKAFLPEAPITVESACCAGVTPESHQKALDVMRSCQITVV